MPGGSTFAFKQFTIVQDKCAMKVGTDAVLLGSWAYCASAPQKILDVGTGTGIIALMMAQKFPSARVTGIDIDHDAYVQASENISKSKWPDRISIVHVPLQDYFPSHQFDLIISNPPYFINSSKAPHHARTLARHSDLLPYEALIDGVVRLLNSAGCFFIILPQKEGEIFIEMAKTWNLSLNHLTRVKTKHNSPEAKRLLMRFSFVPQQLLEDELIIEAEARHQYSEEYKNLTRDFYLNF